jgi:glutamyl-tRNA reductase
VAESLAEMQGWSQVLRVSPLISRLKANLEHVRQQELQRHHRRLNPAENALLDIVTQTLMQQVLKQQVLHLKRACQHDNAERLLEQLSELFALNSQPAT